MENDIKREHGQQAPNPQEKTNIRQSVINPDGTYNEGYANKESRLTNLNTPENINLIPNPDDFDEGDNDGGEDNERDATRTPGL